MSHIPHDSSRTHRAVAACVVVAAFLFAARCCVAQSDSSATVSSAGSSQRGAASDTMRSEPQAPTRMVTNSRLFVPSDEFGMALTAAILKKNVPVIAMTDSTKADFFVHTVSHATKEGGAERVAKILAFGAWAGSGKQFNATVTITNRDGAVLFAHNSKKENFQSAAENVAKKLKQYINGE